MKILYIDHYVGSVEHGMEFRPYYMAREWKKHGHEITMLGADFSHLRTKNPVIHRSFEEETIDGIRYVWVKTNRYKGNGIGRVLNILTFVYKVRRRAKRLAARYAPDAVIASSTYPLDIYPADKIAKAAGARLIYEIHDLWPLVPMEFGGLSEKNPIIRVLQKAEDYAFGNADAVVSCWPRADLHMKERGFSTDHFVYVPNGVIRAEGETRTSDAPQVALLAEKRKEGYFVTAYTGNHSPANALEMFIDAACLVKAPLAETPAAGTPLAETPPAGTPLAGTPPTGTPLAETPPTGTPYKGMIFVLVGSGNDKEKLMAYAKEKHADNVLFLDPVPKKDMTALLQQVDAAYMGLKRQNIFKYGISPNKLYDYMLAARPVIFAVEAPNDPVTESGCGVTAVPDDPRSIADAVLHLASLTEEERQAMGEKGRDYVLRYHDYPVLAKRFEDALTHA